VSDGNAARVQLRVHGRVQGVWFRAHTRDAARQLRLTGWVRNAPDGTVEAVAEGPRADCEALIAWCHEGSPLSRVERIETHWGTPAGEFTSFEARFH
jgi:acylphosphatase